MTRSPRPSPSVFAYCKRSNTGGGNGLGTRLWCHHVCLSPWCHDVTMLSPWCHHVCVVAMMSRCHHVVTMMSPWCHRDVCIVSPWCHHDVSIASLWCQYVIVTTVWFEWHMNLTKNILVVKSPIHCPFCIYSLFTIFQVWWFHLVVVDPNPDQEQELVCDLYKIVIKLRQK